MTKRRISPLDIPIASLEKIEIWAGVGLDAWPEGVPSMVGLYGRIYAAATGQEYDAISGTLTARELLEAVTLGDDEEVPAPAGTDPTTEE